MTGVFCVSTVDIWAEQSCYGAVVNYKIFSRISGLYPLDVAMTPSPDLVTYPLGNSYTKASVLLTTMGLSICMHDCKISHAWQLARAKACGITAKSRI